MQNSQSSTENNVGSSYPLGTVVYPQGVNFSVFSKNATSIDLLLFQNADDVEPYRVIRFDPSFNRTYHYWHIFIPSLQSGQIYGYRACGPYDPATGMRFDPAKTLLDPYGRGVVVPKNYSRDAIKKNYKAPPMKSVVVDM